MTYTVFEPRVLPFFIYYIALSVFGIYITVKMINKWRERKVKAPLYLSIVFILLTLALLMLTAGLAEAVIMGYYMEIYRFSLPFGYSMVVIADIFLLRFFTEITEKGKKAFIPLIIIGFIVIVLLFLPWNWWGVPPIDYEGLLNIRLYSTLSMILFSYAIYILIAITCRRIIKVTEDKVARTGLVLLFYAMICMILFFLMFIGDTLVLVITDHPGYTEFVYIAWLFGVAFFILTYFSLVMPHWLMKRIQK